MIEKLTWPSAPYKGLSFYGPDDLLLYAGRDEEIQECARLLVRSDARIMILQGETGCGKSSFLRAGLIPYLEHRGVGYHFIRESHANSNKALFIRSTDKPIQKIAEAIFEFAEKSWEISTPLGPETITFTDSKHGYSNVIDYQKAVESEFIPLLLSSIRIIADRTPDTLIFVLDQAEEVLTLNSGEGGDSARNDFFDFLDLLESTEIDIKLVVAIRTEYFGRFDEQITRRKVNDIRFSSFMLHDMSQDALISAIIRPTLGELPNSFEHVASPYSFYHFIYEEGLPQCIAADLLNSPTRGGILPMMQIVCERLYNETKERAEGQEHWTITSEDYKRAGGVEGPIGNYVGNILFQRCFKAYHSAPLAKVFSELDQIFDEAYNWEEVLALLIRTHADGTVTTDLRPVEELREKALSLGCKINFDEMMSYLSADEQRLLRPAITVLQKGTNREVQCYSLGHDAVGLMLSVSSSNRNTTKKVLKNLESEVGRSRRFMGYATVFYSVVFLAALLYSEHHVTGIPVSGTIRFLLAFFSLMFAVAGTISIVRKKELTNRELMAYWRLKWQSENRRYNVLRRLYFSIKKRILYSI